MRPKPAPFIIAMLPMALAGCGKPAAPIAPTGQSATAEAAPKSVADLVASEELILLLTPRLKQLNQAAANLTIPDHRTRSIFSAHVAVQDIMEGPPAVPSSESSRGFVVPYNVPIAAQAERIPNGTLNIHHPLLDTSRYVDHASFYLIRGDISHENPRQFLCEAGLHALLFTDTGVWRSVETHYTITWERAADSPATVAESWQIVRWETRDIELQDATHRMFADVLERAIPETSEREPLKTSQHWLYSTRHYYPRIPAKLPDGTFTDNRFFVISTAEHPALSVVDLNRDGWDDLYVTERWGKNQLLLNQGNGTFREAAAQYRLDIDGRSNGAIFADFDNDGDDDAIIARSTERSLYLVNENGLFSDRSSDLVSIELPYQATSVSAVDYNGDGLLDIYFATYHQEDVNRRLDANLGHPDHRIHKMLTPEHSAELLRRHGTEHRSFINQVGPPNILLVNRGNGHFELAPENDQVAVWRNSFQGTWSDYDDDGDPDLYVANDFAPDQLLRNDGPDGFVDITREAGVAALNFGMGVTWGDYDNDLRMDLYVSNMYSKAGTRITSQIEGLDPRIADLARGNYLYRNTPQRLELVSGSSPPALAVAKAGWSWGGQFADVDNDGLLDIYVSSGYYSVPPEFETDVDL